jgi:hypothetical protein
MFADDETGPDSGKSLDSVAPPSLNGHPWGDATPRAKRPWGYELRARIAVALEKLITQCDRQQLIFAFSSNRFHLVIDEHYQVYVARSEAIPPGSFSALLGDLELDTSAIELGGGAKRAALENAAQTALAKFGRPEWWVA